MSRETIEIEGSRIYLSLHVDGRDAVLQMDGGAWYLKEGHGYPDWKFLVQGRVAFSQVVARALHAMGADE